MAINPLANLYNLGNIGATKTKTTTPSNIPTPIYNSGASYLDNGARITGAGETAASTRSWNDKLNNQLSMWATNNVGVDPTTNTSLFGAGVQVPTTVNQQQGIDLYAKYRDPKTGEIMTPEEYAIYLGNRVPKGTGQIPNYAGDAMMYPDETSNQLITRATNLNNARNDLAVGEADPYSVGNKSGIAYSPSELRAIEKAYAGIYDPALNDVFSRLRDRQAEEAKKAAMEERVFETNEAIRQWKATTGSKTSSSSSSGSTTNWTPLQLRTGALNAGMSQEVFNTLDDEVKMFFYKLPKAKDEETGETKSIYSFFQEDLDRVMNGELDYNDMIDSIANQTLSDEVKTYLIDQIPDDIAPKEEKEGWFSKIWHRLPFVY